jgi:hypothetical protein
MDCPDYIIIEPKRKPGQPFAARRPWGHTAAVPSRILHNRAIAREIHCSPLDACVGYAKLRSPFFNDAFHKTHLPAFRYWILCLNSIVVHQNVKSS